MRIVLASAGSRGDVQPLQALGLGLLKAGHSVVLCAAPDFAASSAELGVPFVPVGSGSRGLLQVHFAAIPLGGARRPGGARSPGRSLLAAHSPAADGRPRSGARR